MLRELLVTRFIRPETSLGAFLSCLKEIPMNGGTWGGEAASNGNVDYEASYAISPPQDVKVSFTVDKYFNGLHVAHALAREWNRDPSRPRAEVESIQGDPVQGRVWIAAQRVHGKPPKASKKPQGVTFAEPLT